MLKGNRQKMKLLYVVQILRQESDEDHPMTTSMLCERMRALGISYERRTVGLDMRLLNECGFEIMCKMIGHEKAYYVEDRSFSVPEIKILMDAIQAAKFVPPQKSADLIDKIASLAGSHRAELLKENLVVFNTRKHTNESVYYNIDTLERALREKKRASFCYFDLDENHQRIYRKEHNRYVVAPVALVLSNDNYYLMCNNEKYHAVTTYRVDRMDAVNVEAEAVHPDAVLQASNVDEYTEQVFQMFNGEQSRVTLQFDRSLLGVIYDKFGEDTAIRARKNGQLEVDLTVQVSPTFWGWLFQFGESMLISAPADLAKKSKEIIERR